MMPTVRKVLLKLRRCFCSYCRCHRPRSQQEVISSLLEDLHNMTTPIVRKDHGSRFLYVLGTSIAWDGSVSLNCGSKKQ